jgi:ATP-dependent RNA helicase DDX24/MAK5
MTLYMQSRFPRFPNLTHPHLPMHAQVTEAYLDCTEDDRDERLYYLLSQHPGRTLIFANAISMVRRLAAILKLLQLPVTAMHSSMQQRQRLKALERFRESDSAILVATDVAARGLDIPVSQIR